MIDRLVISGCSYMEHYTDGGGHAELAKTLNINKWHSLAQSGSCNDRIVRSVLRDCFNEHAPTLYVVGLTFLHRYELPIKAVPTGDGLWESCSQMVNTRSRKWRANVSLDEYNTYSALRAHMFYLNESLEKIMYVVLSMIHTVKSRGHRIIVFNTAESGVDEFLDQDRYRLLDVPEMIGKFKWRSNQYQFDQGAMWSSADVDKSLYVRHVAPGQHKWLNDFLTNYIQEHKILQ